MKREDKGKVVEQLAEELGQADAVFAVDYRGLTVKQAESLRTELRSAGASFKVVKNTLTERAADQAGFDSLKEHLAGPTALAFVKGDVALAAKTLKTHADRLDSMPFKGGLMEGRPVNADEVKQIAQLPSRDVLIGMLVGMVATPLSGLVRSLNGLPGGLAVQLGKIQEQGLVGGSSSDAA